MVYSVLTLASEWLVRAPLSEQHALHPALGLPTPMCHTFGFSTKRCTWPYSSMTTTPYLEGSSTYRKRVAEEGTAWWPTASCERS